MTESTAKVVFFMLNLLIKYKLLETFNLYLYILKGGYQ